MCEFESVILKAKEGESPVSPFGIVSQLENIGSQLSNGREEDAHEFLRCGKILFWNLNAFLYWKFPFEIISFIIIINI